MSNDVIDVKREELKEEVLPVVREAEATQVESAVSYQHAASFLKNVKAAQKKVKEFFSPLKATAKAAHSAVCAGEREMLAPLTEAESGVKRKMLAWQQEQERIARERERKLQAQAEAKARKERERLEKRAAAAVEKGQIEKAESLEDKAAEVIAPVVHVESEAPKVEGIKYRVTWRARVTREEDVPRQWLIVDDKALQAFARATKGSKSVAGVEFYSEKTMAAG